MSSMCDRWPYPCDSFSPTSSPAFNLILGIAWLAALCWIVEGWSAEAGGVAGKGREPSTWVGFAVLLAPLIVLAGSCLSR